MQEVGGSNPGRDIFVSRALVEDGAGHGQDDHIQYVRNSTYDDCFMLYVTYLLYTGLEVSTSLGRKSYWSTLIDQKVNNKSLVGKISI